MTYQVNLPTAGRMRPTTPLQMASFNSSVWKVQLGFGGYGKLGRTPQAQQFYITIFV